MQGFLYIIFIAVSALFVEHDIHLSVTELTKDGDSLELEMKIFLDDLQTAMGLVPGEELPEDYTGSDDLIQKFVDDRFKLTLNDIRLRPMLSSTASALPAVWATFTIDTVAWQSVNALEIENIIMTDLYDDQKNIVKIEIDDFKKDIIFSTKKTSELLNL